MCVQYNICVQKKYLQIRQIPFLQSSFHCFYLKKFSRSGGNEFHSLGYNTFICAVIESAFAHWHYKRITLRHSCVVCVYAGLAMRFIKILQTNIELEYFIDRHDIPEFKYISDTLFVLLGADFVQNTLLQG